MSVLDEVLKHLDGNTLGAIAQQIGASPQQTQSAIQVALPAILGGMQRNIANGGADALHSAVNKDHGSVDLGSMLGGILGGAGGAGGAGGLLSSVMGMMGGAGGGAGAGGAAGLLGSVMGMMGGGGQQQAPGALGAGMKILGHVLGGSQQRATQGVAQASGLSGAGASALMAMLAPMVMGALGKMTSGQGLNAQGLAGVIGGDVSRLGHSGAPQQKGFMNGLLDADGDGDVDAADLLSRGSMLMGLFGKR